MEFCHEQEEQANDHLLCKEKCQNDFGNELKGKQTRHESQQNKFILIKLLSAKWSRKSG